MTSISMSTKSMVALGNYLARKKFIAEDNDKIRNESAQCKPDCNLTQFILDHMFQIDDSNNLHNHIGYELVTHRAEKKIKMIINTS